MSITLKDAKKIAKKLDAEVEEARKHTIHRIVIEGTYVGQFGLSSVLSEKFLLLTLTDGSLDSIDLV